MPRLTPAPNQPSAVAGALGDSAWSQVRFDALGTTVAVAVRGGGPGLLIDARQLVDDDDRRWNPHRPDSLVARMESGEGAVPVDDETYALVVASLRGRGGDRRRRGQPGGRPARHAHRVEVPADAVLDLDDLARAHCADHVAEALIEGGADGAAVDVGGCLRLAGTVAPGTAWVVAVAGTAGLGLAEGACVTVLRPTAALASLTVLAPDAATAMVPAAAGDLDLVTAAGLPALAVTDDGEHHHLGGITAYLRD